MNQSIYLSKYDNTTSIINSGGKTTRQLTALTVALEKNTPLFGVSLYWCSGALYLSTTGLVMAHVCHWLTAALKHHVEPCFLGVV